jgi:hypothetical protein
VVEETLAGFEEDAGPGRVRLSGIAFEEMRGTLGSYNPAHARIALDPAQSDAELADTTRHELCHALDEDLSANRSNLYGDVADRLFPLFSDEARDDYRSAKERAREAFAQTCGSGRLAAQAVAEGGPGVDDLAVEVAGALLGRVWRDAPAPVPLAMGPAVSFAEPVTFEEPVFHVHAGGVLGLRDAVSGAERHVDLETGLPREDESLGAIVSAEPASRPPGQLVVWGGAVATDTELSAVQFALGPIFLSGVQPVAFDGDRWTLRPTSCCSPLATPFSDGDRLWLGWGDAWVATWAPVVESSP